MAGQGPVTDRANKEQRQLVFLSLPFLFSFFHFFLDKFFSCLEQCKCTEKRWHTCRLAPQAGSGHKNMSANHAVKVNSAKHQEKKSRKKQQREHWSNW